MRKEISLQRPSPPVNPVVRAAAYNDEVLVEAEVLGQLPDDHREVIILRHLEGLTFPEVAARLEKSTDSVKKLWVRALVRLRGLLGEMVAP